MAISGDSLILGVYDGAAYRPVACLTTNSLNEATEVRESRTKCFPNQVKKSKGVDSYTLNAEGEYIDTTSVGGDTAKASHDYLRELKNGSELVTWRMSTGLVDTPYYYGESIITDLSLTAPTAEDSTFSVTFDGSGVVLTEDPTA